MDEHAKMEPADRGLPVVKCRKVRKCELVRTFALRNQNNSLELQYSTYDEFYVHTQYLLESRLRKSTGKPRSYAFM